MRERAQHAGGELHLQSAPGSGTTIEMLLPYK
jgi:signal transduction histidine kinase